MDAILQMTFPKAFLEWKSMYFVINFTKIWFQLVQIAIHQVEIIAWYQIGNKALPVPRVTYLMNANIRPSASMSLQRNTSYDNIDL